jgi:hypothetical protein
MGSYLQAQSPFTVDREQERAVSLHPGGQAEATAEPSNQVSNDARRQQRTPADTGGRWFPGQVCPSTGSGRRDLASGRRGRVRSTSVAAHSPSPLRAPTPRRRDRGSGTPDPDASC